MVAPAARSSSELLHEAGAGPGIQRQDFVGQALVGRPAGHRGRRAVEGRVGTLQDEGRHAEPLALEAAGLEIVRVRSDLGVGRRPVQRRVASRLARHGRQRDRRVGDGARDGAGIVQHPIQRRDPRDAHQPAGRKNPHQRAGRHRHADGVGGVGAGAQHRHVGADRGHRAAGGAAGRITHVIGIAGAAEGGGAAFVGIGEIRHVGVADDDGAGRLELGHHRRVPGRDQFVAGKGEALPAVGRHLAGDGGVGLDDDGHTPKQAMACGLVGILARRHGQRVPVQQGFHRAIDAVILFDPRQIPLHDLGDGVFVRRVEALQLRHRDLDEIAVHVRPRWRFGVRRGGNRQQACAQKNSDDLLAHRPLPMPERGTVDLARQGDKRILDARSRPKRAAPGARGILR